MNSKNENSEKTDPAPATILVVEDEKPLLKLIQKSLGQAGYHTEGVSSGSDALEKISKGHFTLLLTDYGLPDMSGEQFIKALTRTRHNIPFIVITGQGDEKIAVRMMKLGARDYIIKDSAFLNMLPQIVHLVLEQLTTEEKLANAEEALRESERKYRELVETSSDLIATINTNGSLTFANAAWKKRLGYCDEEFKHLTSPETIHPEDLAGLEEIFWQVLKGRTVENVEFRYITKEGAEISVLSNFSPILDHQGKVQALLGISRDITERKQAEEKRRQLERMKAEFISNISHELRTPLNSIAGFTRLILDGMATDSGTQQEFLTIIMKQSENLQNLIDELLDMSRLESGRFRIQKKRVALTKIICETIEGIRAHASEKNIIINADMRTAIPQMDVDGKRLTQVLTNLLSNAIKFSNPGSSITVTASVEDGQALVQVIDQGIGIPQEAIPHLFEKFYRVEEDMTRGGTGLGLYICKQIIEAHEGSIWVESKKGKGSTFSFTIPLGKTEEEAHQLANSISQ